MSALRGLMGVSAKGHVQNKYMTLNKTKGEFISGKLEKRQDIKLKSIC